MHHVSITGENLVWCKYLIISCVCMHSYTLLICCIYSIFVYLCVIFAFDKSTIHILVCLSLTPYSDFSLFVNYLIYIDFVQRILLCIHCCKNVRLKVGLYFLGWEKDGTCIIFPLSLVGQALLCVLLVLLNWKLYLYSFNAWFLFIQCVLLSRKWFVLPESVIAVDSLFVITSTANA